MSDGPSLYLKRARITAIEDRVVKEIPTRPLHLKPKCDSSLFSFTIAQKVVETYPQINEMLIYHRLFALAPDMYPSKRSAEFDSVRRETHWARPRRTMLQKTLKEETPGVFAAKLIASLGYVGRRGSKSNRGGSFYQLRAFLQLNCCR